MSGEYEIFDPDNVVGAYLLCMGASREEMSGRELELYEEHVIARKSEQKTRSRSVLARTIKKATVYF